MHFLFLALLLLKVIKENRQGASFLAEVSNDGATRPNRLLYLTFGIKLSQSTPGTEFLSSFNHDDGDFSLGTEGTNELLVLLVFAVLGKAAKTSGTTVKSLGTLV